MKKHILKAFVTLAVLAMATSAFAVTTITSAGSSIGGGSYKASTGVTVKALATATDYAVTAQHMSSKSNNGGKQYGTKSNESSILSATAIDADHPTAPTSATALPAAFQ